MPSRIGNFFMKGIINSPLHPILGNNFAVITFKGIKSGKPYSTPINVIDLDGILTAISLRQRTWWRNLRTGATASLRRSGKTVCIRSEVIETVPGVTGLLIKYFLAFPGNARYFNVKLSSDEKPAVADLERSSGERVIVRFHPV